MQISSTKSATYQPVGDRQSVAKMKKSFQELGSALASGKLADAKTAFADLQKDAPAPPAGQANNPVRAKVEVLSKALEAGDLKGAQQAYADIKKTMSQRPPAGGRPAGGTGGRPQGGAPPSGASKASGASASSSTSKVYDQKDANQDGTVSWEEELTYSLKHPDGAGQASATAEIDAHKGAIDLTA